MKPVIRCSSLDRLLNCHGSRTLEPMVAPRAGDEGLEGSFGHWTVAMRMWEEFGANGSHIQSPAIPAGYKLPKMSEWIVDWFLRIVRDEIPPNYALTVEDEMVYEFDRFILSGHQDITACNNAGTNFIGLDEKWGYKPVLPAEFNWQVMGYLALAKRAYPNLTHAKYGIGQPRNSEEDGFPRLSWVELDGNGLDACVAILEEKIDEAIDDPMAVNSGMSQCAWCPVGAQCPAIQKELEFMKATLTPEILAAIQATPNDKLLGDIIISSRTSKRSLEDAEEMLKARIEKNGHVVSGDGVRITMKIEGGQYAIIDPDGAFNAVSKLLPPERLPHVVKYSSDRLIDEIATAKNIPKSGKADVTARSVFDSVVKPHFKQGERRKLLFS